jgi:antitoxin component of MazEF toxin-antitoxin module
VNPSSPEKGFLAPSGTPERSQAVLQPSKAEGLAMLVAEINELPGETTTEDATSDWSTSGGTGMTAQGAQQGTSARDQALANLPVPAQMQKQLEAHIRSEVKELRKQTKLIIRSRKPGSAYALAQMYAKIRHLNALLADLFEASYDVLKRLFVKVFIDHQAIG